MGCFAMGRGERCAEESFGEDEVAIGDRGHLHQQQGRFIERPIARPLRGR